LPECATAGWPTVHTSVFTIGPCWGRLQCSSESLAGFGRPSSKERGRRGGGNREMNGRKKGREGITMGFIVPKVKFSATV